MADGILAWWAPLVVAAVTVGTMLATARPSPMLGRRPRGVGREARHVDWRREKDQARP